MEALLTEIACAKHHIHIQYYILNDDETGRRLRDALIAKAREGVEVRILYDDVGMQRRAKKSFFEQHAQRRHRGATPSCTSSSRSSPARSTTATTARSPSSTAAWASSAA